MKNEELYNEMCGLMQDLPNQKILSDFKEWYAAHSGSEHFATLFVNEYGVLYESLGGTVVVGAPSVAEVTKKGMTKSPATINDLYKPIPVADTPKSNSRNYADLRETSDKTPEWWGNVIAGVVLWLGVLGAVALIITGIAQYDDWDNVPVDWVLIIAGIGSLLSSLVVWAVLRLLVSISTTLGNR